MSSWVTFRRALGVAIVAAALASTTAMGSHFAASTGPASLARDDAGGKVTVRITFTNNGADVSNGALAGTGHFTARGAITDNGKSAVYRTKKGRLIILRFVTVGKKGAITFVVKIDTYVGTSRWTILSGTKTYRGLHGKGTEHENAQYTVSTLTGTVWR